ncbi:hypothetical protein B0I37DRAFT_314566 [Chaetomium sp. MPI-CAGE-AT-0009]|nr:hypothetical protein B0I37DRAFT_314566 [Chaetomium sp. MPI-CAGE-AT-0009]
MSTWRPMTERDIPNVMLIANEVHCDLPEQESVFRERLPLFPKGCIVLVGLEPEGEEEEVRGYVISFPIRYGKLPGLNEQLGQIPRNANQYYLHDIAVLPEFRWKGAAAEGMRQIMKVACLYPTTCLVSVYGTVPFWGRFKFTPEPRIDAIMEEKLQSYGTDAAYLVYRSIPSKAF